MLSFHDALVSLGVAVAAGLLLGTEREQSAAEIEDFGGIRTFPLLAVLGALGGLVQPVAGLWVLGGLLLGVIAFMTVSHVRSSAKDDIGISSEIAGLLAFSLGALASMRGLMPDGPRFLLVGAISALALALLALKKPLHDFAARVSTEDLYATVKFVVLALLVLPVLPHESYGPFNALSPYKIGKMIVLIAGISFAGYVAARIVGAARGLLVAGLLGGLVSSTAVTLTYSGRARTEPALAPLCAVAITSACSMMFGRVLVVVALLDPSLAVALAPAFGAMTLTGFGASWIAYHRARGANDESDGTASANTLRNPFALRQAVGFGLVYGVVLLLAKAAQAWLGAAGLYVSSVAAGLTDVDAITLSVAEMHRGGLDGRTASIAIVLAAVTNTIVKGGIALSTGGPVIGRRVAITLGTALGAGALAHGISLAAR